MRSDRLPLVFVAALLLAPAALAAPPGRTLRVCSDPNNLPFSNERREGFENRIAEVVARELGARLEYVWKPHRRGFLRTGLSARACDLVMGVPTELEMALTTRPYYRSTYVFVARRGGVDVRTFDDPALARLRIGVQLIGDDYANAPPAHALARRGLARNLVGYTVYGDYATESPPAEVVRAVERGDVDLSVVWGPLAGFHARRSAVPLAVRPVPATAGPLDAPMIFEISMAVRRGDRALAAELDRVIQARRKEIDAILRAYGVPRV
jgi:mxaJ protein